MFIHSYKYITFNSIGLVLWTPTQDFDPACGGEIGLGDQKAFGV
jgi:hypothetical protein